MNKPDLADFLTAFRITNNNEGYYSNNPADRGGETVQGIARNFWPNWHGWPIVDATKKATTNIHTLNESLAGNAVLQGYVHDFYKANFWDVNSLDLINDQQVANTTYDQGVNGGTGIAAEMLQKAAGVLADRKIGPKTIAAVNSDDPESIYNSINNQREARYKQLAVGSQAQFLHSWISRLVPYSVS